MTFPRTRPLWAAVSFLALATAVAGSASALPLEARWPTFGPRYFTDLARAYKSNVDPRLNYEQSIEMAMLIVRKQTQGAPVTPAGN